MIEELFFKIVVIPYHCCYKGKHGDYSYKKLCMVVHCCLLTIDSFVTTKGAVGKAVEISLGNSKPSCIFEQN